MCASCTSLTEKTEFEGFKKYVFFKNALTTKTKESNILPREMLPLKGNVYIYIIHTMQIWPNSCIVRDSPFILLFHVYRTLSPKPPGW